MSDLEEEEVGPAPLGLSDFSDLRTAEDFSDYSLLELQWNGLRFAAVPALVRDGGVLVVVPEEAFSEEELTLASADGFDGFIGPFVNGSCTVRGARRAELTSEVQALIVDLDSTTLSDPEVDGALAPCTESSLRELTGFGVVKGRSTLWPSAEGVRRLVDLYRKLASPEHLPHRRTSPYMTADEGLATPGGLPVHSGPAPLQSSATTGASDSRLEALEAQVRALVSSQTALLSTQRDPGQSSGGTARGSTSVPPLFEAEAGRAGLSLEQLTALLGAAGRPPEKLHDGRQAALPGASSSNHLTLQDKLAAQGSTTPPAPHTLPKALPAARPTGPQGPGTGDLDATSLLAALVQQNNNLLGVLTKNRGDTLSDSLEPEERPASGVRGYQARQQFQASLKRDPTAVYSAVRRRLAEAVETDEGSLPGAAMRTFFTNKVPLGSMRGLTYFAFATAQLWEAAERDDLAALKAQVALLAVYLEQVAVDGGRHQLGWLLTGLPNPPFQLVQAHSQRAQEDPVGFLGDPRWVAANLAYLKDVDYLESRTKLVGKAPPSDRPGGPPPKPTPKARPKGAPKAASTAAAGGSEDP